MSLKTVIGVLFSTVVLSYRGKGWLGFHQLLPLVLPKKKTEKSLRKILVKQHTVRMRKKTKRLQETVLVVLRNTKGFLTKYRQILEQS